MGWLKRRIIKAMEPKEEPPMEVRAWIPVSQRLPPDEMECLVIDENGVERIARYSEARTDSEYSSFYEEKDWTTLHPVAWMPPPAPPTDGK
jgi:hypothetical protein